MIAEQQCTYPGCDFPCFAACAHTARCVEHAFGDMCTEACCNELAAAFVRFMRDVCTPAVRLGEQLALIRIAMLEGFARIYEHFYPAYREAYDDAGALFGPDDAAMWRWHEERFSAADIVVTGEEISPRTALRLAARGGQILH